MSEKKLIYFTVKNQQMVYKKKWLAYLPFTELVTIICYKTLIFIGDQSKKINNNCQ